MAPCLYCPAIVERHIVECQTIVDFPRFWPWYRRPQLLPDSIFLTVYFLKMENWGIATLMRLPSRSPYVLKYSRATYPCLTRINNIWAKCTNSNVLGESIITGLIAGVTALTLLLLNAIGLIILRRRRTKTIDQLNSTN